MAFNFLTGYLLLKRIIVDVDPSNSWQISHDLGLEILLNDGIIHETHFGIYNYNTHQIYYNKSRNIEVQSCNPDNIDSIIFNIMQKDNYEHTQRLSSISIPTPELYDGQHKLSTAFVLYDDHVNRWGVIHIDVENYCFEDSNNIDLEGFDHDEDEIDLNWSPSTTSIDVNPSIFDEDWYTNVKDFNYLKNEIQRLQMLLTTGDNDKIVSRLIDSSNSTETEIISISQHFIENENISNRTIDEFENICGLFMDIRVPNSLLNYQTFLQNHYTTNVQCVYIEDYFDNINGSNNTLPDEISLFLLDGKSNLSVDIISIHGDNCNPIIINLNWNQNNEYNLSKYIPQCGYNKPLNNDDKTINKECFTLNYNQYEVQCGCTQFGTYSVLATQIQPIKTEIKLNYSVIFYTLTVILIIPWLIAWLSSCCGGRYDDGAFVAKEVFMQQRHRFRAWLLTKEGKTHGILRYGSKLLICNLWCHFIKNNGLICSFCFRNKGSNYYITQRILNLVWLLLSITLFAALIIIYSNQSTSICIKNTENVCISLNTLFISSICVLILSTIHYIHRLLFQRITPNKFKIDIHKLVLQEFDRLHRLTTKQKSLGVTTDLVVKNKKKSKIISDLCWNKKNIDDSDIDSDSNSNINNDVEMYEEYLKEIKSSANNNKYFNNAICDTSDPSDLSSAYEYNSNNDKQFYSEQDEELGYKQNKRKNISSSNEEWTTDDDEQKQNITKINKKSTKQSTSFFKIIEGIASVMRPKQPISTTANPDRNSSRFLKRIFFDQKDKNQLQIIEDKNDLSRATASIPDSDEMNEMDDQIGDLNDFKSVPESEDLSLGIPYISHSGPSNPSHSSRKTQKSLKSPTKSSMNTPKPMIGNDNDGTRGDDDNELKNDDPGGNSDSINNDIHAGSGGYQQSAASSHETYLKINSSEIYQELIDRKIAMKDHYFIPYKCKKYLFIYLVILIILISITLVSVTLTYFNDSSIVNTQPVSNNSYLESQTTCGYNVVNSINDEYLNTENGDNYTQYRYSDSLQWIILSICCFLLSIFILYPMLLFIESIILIFRFKYFSKNGTDPLYCCFEDDKKYSYPNASHLTRKLDPTSLYLPFRSRTPPQTKINHTNMNDIIDDVDTEDIMNSIHDAADDLVNDDKSDDSLSDEKQDNKTNDDNNKCKNIFPRIINMDNQENQNTSHVKDASLNEMSTLPELPLSPPHKGLNKNKQNINNTDDDNLNEYIDKSVILFDDKGNWLDKPPAYITPTKRRSDSDQDDGDTYRFLNSPP